MINKEYHEFLKEETDLFPEGIRNSLFPEGLCPEGNKLFVIPEGNKLFLPDKNS